jgi:hypothetical protein
VTSPTLHIEEIEPRLAQGLSFQSCFGLWIDLRIVIGTARRDIDTPVYVSRAMPIIPANNVIDTADRDRSGEIT